MAVPAQGAAFAVSGASGLDDIYWTPEPKTIATLDYIVRALTTPDDTGTSALERIYQTYPRETERDLVVIKRGFELAKSRLKHVYIWFYADCPDDGWCSFHMATSSEPISTSHIKRKAKKRFSLNLLKERHEWLVPDGACPV